MALELVYEGLISGLKNVSSANIQSASVDIVPGRICCLSYNSGTKVAGEVYFATLANAVDVPFGLVADYKEDAVASGKVSVYFTPGLYMTDQTSEGQGAIVKGSILSFTVTGLLAVAQTGDYVVGICTEDTDDSGFIELYLNISGYVLP